MYDFDCQSNFRSYISYLAIVPTKESKFAPHQLQLV